MHGSSKHKIGALLLGSALLFALLLDSLGLVLSMVLIASGSITVSSLCIVRARNSASYATNASLKLQIEALEGRLEEETAMVAALTGRFQPSDACDIY